MSRNAAPGSTRGSGSALRASSAWRLAVGLLALAAASPAAAERQSPETIREAAEAFLTAELEDAFDEVRVEARGVDSRLNLDRCDGELQAFVPHGRSAQRASTVGVECSGDAPWTVYVRMEVEARAEMVVAQRSVRRGHRLSAGDLTLAPRDARRIRGDFYRDPERLIGQEARRGLREGQPVTGNDVQPPMLVQRGDRVDIVAGGNNSLRISGGGRALERGREGDRIRVENLDSGREIQAQVVDEGRVRVGL